MERLLKTPFCSALDPSVPSIQYALMEFSYGYVSIRPSCFATRLGMPPFVLCVCANLTSAALTNRSEDGGSQAEQAVALRREISLLRTRSRLYHTAREIMCLKDFLRKSYVTPDFRLHPSSEIGSLYFVRWDSLNGYAQTPPKSP